MDKRFIDAEFCEAQAGLSQHQIQQWQGQGFTFVRGLIPQALVSALIDIASDLFPSGGSEAAEHKRGFGSSGALVFPSSYFEFNEVLKQLRPTLESLHALKQQLTDANNNISISDINLPSRRRGTNTAAIVDTTATQ